MRRERQQHSVHEHDMLEVVYDALAIQIVHRDAEEVPVQGLGEAQVLGLAGHVGDGNDLFERDQLNRSDQHDDVDVSREQREEEPKHHEERPYCSRYKRLLLLLVVGLCVAGRVLSGSRVSAYALGPARP